MKIGKMAGLTLAGGCLLAGGAVAGDLDDGSFALPQEVVCAATAFQDYMSSAAHIDSGFASGDGVERSLKAGASYQPAQLEEGMIAYGAIAALQDDRFVQGIETAAGGGDQRAAFAARVLQNPYAATQVDGAIEAGQRVESAITTEAAPLVSIGAQVKAAAYTVQHQAWSKVTVADASGRLVEVKTLSARRQAPSDSENQAMMQALADADPAAGDDASARFSPIEAKALALAAESILGHARGSDRGSLTPLLTESDSAFCLKMAKLNLYQCMAVAGPQYEDIFCLGQHALYDTGECVDHAARGDGAASVAMLPPRPIAPTKVVYAALTSHRTLRIDPN